MLIFALAIPFILSALIYIIPAYLARQRRIDNPTEVHVASHETPSLVFSNAGIAYQLQMATLGPFFVWGATGDLWPALINSVFFGIGLFLLILYRRPIIAFISSSIKGTESTTLHGFMSAAHGDARSVRVLASIFTVIALGGIVIAEMFGAMSVMTPILSGNKEASFLLVVAMFFLMYIYTTIGGNDGVQRTDQFQLGVAYVCLFTILIGLLLVVTRSATVGSAATLAALFAVVCLAVLLWRHRFTFIEFEARNIADDDLVSDKDMRRLSRVYRTLERALNAVVFVVIVVALGLGIYALSRGVLAGGAKALAVPLLMPSKSSIVALTALAILPLVYQLCDLSNWQRLAALRPDLAEPGTSPAVERNVLSALRAYAVESPAIWIILMLFGTIAATAFGGLNATDPFGDFVQRLISSGGVAQFGLFLLVMAALAISLSTMDAVLSAALYAFRYDILYDRNRDSKYDINEPSRQTRVRVFGFAVYGLVVCGLYFAQNYLKAFGGDQYLTILLTVYSAQISFIPLIIGGIWGRNKADSFWNCGAAGALLTLVFGFGTAIGITAWGILSGNTDASWWAIWGCLASSIFVYVASCAVRWLFSAQERPGRVAGK